MAKLLYDVGEASLCSPEVVAMPHCHALVSDLLLKECPMPESRDDDCGVMRYP